MITVYFAARSESWSDYENPLRDALDETGVPYNLIVTCENPDVVDYLVYAPGGPVSDFSPFSNAKAILCLWAGVESIVKNPTLFAPLTRMVDDGLTQGMVEWVTGHVLRHHLGIDQYILGQDGLWRAGAPPLAPDRTVSILGLGELGTACSQALKSLNFNVQGWSRSEKQLDGVSCFYGNDGLSRILANTDILVLLLPLTSETENLINTTRLNQLCKGAVIINPGRGPLIDDQALLSALQSGQIGHATLDVFRTEPLPKKHAFWAHPNITVTPHIASETRPITAARIIAKNIKRKENNLPLLHLVDRVKGY